MVEFFDTYGRPVEDTELINLRRYLREGGTLLQYINDENYTVKSQSNDFMQALIIHETSSEIPVIYDLNGTHK